MDREQRFGLHLAAPIVATGEPCDFSDTLYIDDKPYVTNLLDIDWDVNNVEALEETMHWLLDEGGHTVYYVEIYNKLAPLTFSQRLAHIELEKQRSEGDYIRAKIVHDYFDILSSYTIRAYDYARYASLVRMGATMEWYSEEQTLALLQKLATRVINENSFPTVLSYLFSFYIGRAFAQKHNTDEIIRSKKEMYKLLTRSDSPFNSYGDWPQAQAADQTEVQS